MLSAEVRRLRAGLVQPRDLDDLRFGKTSAPKQYKGRGEVYVGFEACWAVIVSYHLKNAPQAKPLGETEIRACGRASSSGQSGLFSLVGIDNAAKKAAERLISEPKTAMVQRIAAHLL